MGIEDYNYYMDQRNIAASTRKPEEAQFKGRHVHIFQIGEDDEGIPVEIFCPTKVALCPVCGGEGRHVNPSVDCCGLTREDFDEDPDFADEYFSGMYDVSCYNCHGEKVVREPDMEQLSDKKRKLVEDWLDEEAEYAHMCAMERAMGC